MEQDKLLKVDNTIEKLCDFLQKETERVASIYESQELAEMTKALAELMSARAKFNQFSFSLFQITRHGSACMNSIGESRRKDKESDGKDEKKDRSINCGNNHRSYINLDKSYFQRKRLIKKCTLVIIIFGLGDEK